MGVTLLSVGSAANLGAVGWRVPRADLALASDAREALALLAAREAAFEQTLAARLDAASKAGFEQGRRDGAAAAAAAAADTVAVVLRRAQSTEDEVRAAVTDLALDVARRVLGAFDEIALLRQVVSTALLSIRDERPHTLRVNPDLAEPLAEALADSYPILRVVADDRLAADDCVFETGQGLISAGVAVQLAGFRAALSKDPEVRP